MLDNIGSKLIGLYEDTSCSGLPGLWIIIPRKTFHRSGKYPTFRIASKSLVRHDRMLWYSLGRSFTIKKSITSGNLLRPLSQLMDSAVEIVLKLFLSRLFLSSTLWLLCYRAEAKSPQLNIGGLTKRAHVEKDIQRGIRPMSDVSASSNSAALSPNL
ncbi:hypothetical protein EVAR_20515_1 [Eumeta japonica]|uniref:Uncharacterized protein n=1 Tax=Eumeta variegata TaxID=151549 RepID=A0A4C1VLT9_EUMVA|nr:hypothetical protein EVAR_20515_1 [Eumeta japonica]